MRKIYTSEITPSPTATLLKPIPTLMGSMDELGDSLTLFMCKGLFLRATRITKEGNPSTYLRKIPNPIEISKRREPTTMMRFTS
jgi:hypothetical protein